MSYTKKVAFSTASQMIGKLVGLGISLATIAILFRYFGVEGMGKYTTVFAFAGFFSIFADFGLQWTLLRELSITDDKQKAFSNIFAFRLVLAFLVHTLCFAAVWLFNYPIDVKIGVGIISLSWFFTTINSTLVAVFLNNFRVDITVSAEVVGRAVVLLAAYFLTKAQMPLNIVLIGYVGANLVNFLINSYFIRRFIKFKLAFDLKYWRYAVKQAIPIGIVLVFGFVYYKIDSLMLSLMKGMVDVGIYGTAYKLLEVLQIIPSMFLGAAFPIVTKYVATNDKRLPTAFQKQFDFLLLLAFPIVFAVFVLAVPIINFIGGSKGLEFTTASTISIWGQNITSVTCLRILIFSVGVNFITNLYNYFIVSLGKQKWMVLPTIGFAILNVMLNLVLIPKYSYLGAAFATLTTELVVAIVYINISSKLHALPIKFLNSIKILFSAILMSVIMYFLNSIGVNLFINLIVGVLIYLIMTVMLRAVPLDMIKSFAKKE